jgi:hypothetical protein
VFAAQPVIDAQGPDLEVGLDPVNPRQEPPMGEAILPTTSGSWVMPAAPGYPDQPSVFDDGGEFTA